MQLVVGALVDRHDVKWVYAAGFLLWSLAMASTGLANSFAALLAARVTLGIGESVFLPSVSNIVVRLFPADRRGLPNALVDVGTKVGPALSIYIGGMLLKDYGWRVLFIGVGLASLLWLIPWMGWVPKGCSLTLPPTASNDDLSRGLRTGRYGDIPQNAPGRRPALQGQRPDAPPPSEPTQLQPQRPWRPGMLQILAQRETWGTSLGMFALGYVWIFLLTWLPTYLVRERNYSLAQMAVFGSLPFWGMAIASLSGGWASDRWIARCGRPTLVRKTFAVTGLLLCAGLMLPAAFVADQSLSLGFLIAACVSLGIFTSNVWAITQTLAGPEAAGKWTGIQNFIGNLGGVISPVVAGLIVEQTRSFVLAFVVAAVILVMGAASYIFLVPRIESIVWRREARLTNGETRMSGEFTDESAG